jgi:hypothetical protein
MAITIEATFDGEVLRPKQPPDLAPNTRVILTIQPIEEQDPSASFL